VVTEIEIDRPRERVAEYAADPDNAVEWYANIDAVEWRSSPPAEIGSDIAFTARFLGRSLTYTYRIIELVAGERSGVAARVADGHAHGAVELVVGLGELRLALLGEQQGGVRALDRVA